ncbi:hypothetical protein GCM10008164_47380 [Achromobacter xylosoxidans]|nr:hypothetical protein GCM10008164_47380 [Achromobacter xylosoxidans]
MPGTAVYELNADILFQRSQGAADSLQRTVEKARSLCQAPRFSDMDKGFKVFEAAHYYLE